jgi:nitrogen fixation/metabolism regulation signal transduction histidine kinase
MNDLAACQYTLLSALCELIDNSVQATRRNERPMKRAIQITINTKHADPACRTMLLTDNGEGFNAAASEEFATLGTSERARAERESKQASERERETHM